MKKFFILSVLFLATFAETRAQATSLTIDNQTPGWLSSKINFGDQLTVQSLKVSGYLNKEDLKFISELNLRRSLKIIDLTDIFFVAKEGDGEKDNVFPNGIFDNKNFAQKIMLPSSITKCWNEFHNVDTLIVNYIKEEYRTTYYNTKYVSYPEGRFKINIFDTQSVLLPSTATQLYNYTYNYKSKTYFSRITRPMACRIGDDSRSDILYGKMFIPKGTMEEYKSSEFGKQSGLTMIEQYDLDSVSVKVPKKLYVGDTVHINPAIYPGSDLVAFSDYSLNDSNVASIDSGVLYAKAAGQCDITVTPHMLFDDLKTALGHGSFKVYDRTKGIQFEEKMTVYLGTDVELNAHTLPLGTSDDNIEYYSGNISYVNIKNGIMHPARLGTCTITASTCRGNYTASCLVTILSPINRIFLDSHDQEVNIGDVVRLSAKIFPDDTDQTEIEWSSSDETIATVDEYGVVTTKATGTVTITATSVHNKKVFDKCTIVVSQPVTGIKLNESNLKINGIGVVKNLTATVLPENADNKRILWTSSNTSVCIVTNDGTLISAGEGTAIITATTEEGGFMAFCVVTVDSSTGIDDAELDEISIMTDGTRLIVGNKPRDFAVTVFTADGRVAYKGTSSAITLGKGLYIVRVGNKTKKVIVGD